MTFLLAANSALAGCFDGKWKSYDPDLLLELKQHDQQLSGTHLIVAQRGAKIDVSEDENDQTISGIVVHDVANVKFLSSFGGGGQARIVCKNKKLEWKLIEAKGMHWFPQVAILESTALTPTKDVSHLSEPTKTSHTYQCDALRATGLRLLPGTTFEVNYPGSLNGCFAGYLSEGVSIHDGLYRFGVFREGKLVLPFPVIEAGMDLASNPYQYLKILAVSFSDLDGDGRRDVTVIGQNLIANGERTFVQVYWGCGERFVFDDKTDLA